MKTLRQRLTLTHTIVALIAVLIMALLASFAIMRAYRQLEQHNAQTTARQMSHFLSLYYVSAGNWDMLAEDMQARLGNKLLEYKRRIIIMDKEWGVIFDSENKLENHSIPIILRPQSVPIIVSHQPPPPFAPNEGRPAKPGEGEPRRPGYPNPELLELEEDPPEQWENDNPPYRQQQWENNEYPYRLRGNQQLVGYVLVPVGAEERTPEDRAFIRSIAVIVIIGSIVAGMVALVVALIMAKQVTTPIRSLTLAAQRLASGERHQPLDMPADAELAELSQTFNTMATELAHQEDIRRQFMADTAHELRTPLSVLRLQIEGLEDGIEQPTPEIFASLHQEVNLLSRLIEDLRLLSLADAGRLAFSSESLSSQAILARTATVAAPLVRQHKVTLHVEQGEGEGDAALPNVYADPQRLQQVLANLLDNALRYTPEGGKVTLRAYSIAHAPGSTCPSPQQGVAFDVEDTGAGIAAEDLPYIFDRFYRTDKARTRELGGSGLGLAIVQRLIEAQGGRVEVESTPGIGSTFRVILPIADADE